MATDSTTLSIVLMKAASCSEGIYKEAINWAGIGSNVRNAGSAVKSWGSSFRKAPTAVPHPVGPPPLPGASVGSNVQAELARMQAARTASGVASSAQVVPGRVFRRHTPLQGNYRPWMQGWGSKLDDIANKGWGRRALTAIPRHLPFVRKGSISRAAGLGGFGYGFSSANANTQLGLEMEAIAQNAAAQGAYETLQAQKANPWKASINNFLESTPEREMSIAQQIMKKNKRVGQAYWNQRQDPDYFANLIKQVDSNHRYPWKSFWGGNKLQ